MNDYKELIAKLRFYANTADDPIYGICINSPKVMLQAADAIERLVSDYEIIAKMYANVNEDLCVRTKERDAAVEDLKECVFRTVEECHYCQHNFAETSAEHCIDCDGNSEWEWRGVQEVDE